MHSIRIEDQLEYAAELLMRGELVAVPTETVYGLAGNGTDAEVIEKIYETKNRPPLKPLSLMVPDIRFAEWFCAEITQAAYILARHFWPGPLTIVVEAKTELLPPALLAGGHTVGLRCPMQSQTMMLLHMLPFPLAAPSANLSGQKSAVTAQEVLDYFDGKIAAVVDGGPCMMGKESTLVDVSAVPFRILREGVITETEIADVLAAELTLIGITGGSGCGKTTALRVFQKEGALILDGDAIYHELLDEGGDLCRDLEAAFPEAFVAGKLDRRILGSRVFQNREDLAVLNRISHAYIRREIQTRLREFAMQGGQMAVIDAIDLFGDGTKGLSFAATIAVTAPEEDRVRRIVARDGITEEAAKARIAGQYQEEYFLEHCDIVVRNDEDEESFIRRIENMMEERKWKKRKAR